MKVQRQSGFAGWASQIRVIVVFTIPAARGKSGKEAIANTSLLDSDGLYTRFNGV